MSSPYPFSSPSHFINAGSPNAGGRTGGNGQEHSISNLNSPAPSPYFSPYSSNFQSTPSNNPFVGVNSPNNFAPTMSMSLPLQDTFYGSATPTQSPQLYSPHQSIMDSPRMAYPTSPWSPTTSWASTMLPTGMNNSWLGLAGMGFPSHPRPKLTTTLWEDENTVCYQVDAKGICVARRQDNDMVNGTKLLNVTGMSRGKRDGILKNEKGRVVVKVGAMHLKGVWITFQRAKALAAQFKIADLLYPLFVDDPSPFLYNPHCPPNVGSQQMSAPNGNHSYMNSLGHSGGVPSKPQIPYGASVSQLMGGQGLYGSQGISHPPVGSSPSMNSNLLNSSHSEVHDDNEAVNSSHNSPVINSSYSKYSTSHFVPPAEPNKSFDGSGRPYLNLKKRSFDDTEDNYGAYTYSNTGSISSPLAKPITTPLGRTFASFPSPLTLSPSSLPSPSIAQPNSNFHCDISPSMNKRIKLPDAEHYIVQESNGNNEHHDFLDPSAQEHREQNYERQLNHSNALHQESLGLLFENLSPPESESENIYETTDGHYDTDRYESENAPNEQRFTYPQTLKQPQS